ncbi:helix-turn-helix domain-containing protein, partial [Escherichia coli]|nr:helix-turn-helix domain-containing protein [Escherichia coli]
MGSCAAPSAKGDDKFITTDYLQQCQRTNEGRQEAKLKGIKFGRRRTVDRNVVLTLHQKGTGATEIAHQLSIARSTVYKILEDERAS